MGSTIKTLYFIGLSAGSLRQVAIYPNNKRQRKSKAFTSHLRLGAIRQFHFLKLMVVADLFMEASLRTRNKGL